MGGIPTTPGWHGGPLSVVRHPHSRGRRWLRGRNDFGLVVGQRQRGKGGPQLSEIEDGRITQVSEQCNRWPARLDLDRRWTLTGRMNKRGRTHSRREARQKTPQRGRRHPHRSVTQNLPFTRPQNLVCTHGDCEHLAVRRGPKLDNRDSCLGLQQGRYLLGYDATTVEEASLRRSPAPGSCSSGPSIRLCGCSGGSCRSRRVRSCASEGVATRRGWRGASPQQPPADV